MKMAIYNVDGNFSVVYENLTNPQFIGDSLYFDGGCISGLTEKHILLDDSTDIPESLSEALTIDKKHQLVPKATPEEEKEALLERIASLEDVILFLLDR